MGVMRWSVHVVPIIMRHLPTGEAKTISLRGKGLTTSCRRHVTERLNTMRIEGEIIEVRNLSKELSQSPCLSTGSSQTHLAHGFRSFWMLVRDVLLDKALRLKKLRAYDASEFPLILSFHIGLAELE